MPTKRLVDKKNEIIALGPVGKTVELGDKSFTIISVTESVRFGFEALDHDRKHVVDLHTSDVYAALIGHEKHTEKKVKMGD